MGKLIREAAINGLLDDAALEVGFGACKIVNTMYVLYRVV